MATRKPAVYVKFSQAVFDRICALIAEGKSVRQACDGDGMPDRTTFRDWCRANPELQTQYDRACLDREDVYFEQIIEVADTATDHAKARNQIEARKWTLARMNRKKYGERMTTEHTGEDGGEIKHVHTVNLVAMKRGGSES
jgi:hypothetical protein